MRLAAGTTIGRFKVLGLIGRGGMGEVHVAEELSSGAKVALKVLAQGAGLTADSTHRFERERELLARVSHPGVVRALGPLEVDESSGLAHFPMELVLGKSLADLLAEHGRFAIVEAVRVLAAVAAALEATHERGIVHRDVKPSNVLLARGGDVRLTDFGLARALDSSRYTATGSALGTPTYMAPEQCLARESVAETDLYALGVLAHELLAGSPPFKAENPVALLRLHVEAKPEPLRALRPEVPERLEAIVQRLLAKEPVARRPNPRAELEALHQELTHGSAEFVKRLAATIDRDTVSVAALALPGPESRSRLADARFVLLPVLAAVALGGTFLFQRAPVAPAVEVQRATLVLLDGASLAGTVSTLTTETITIVDGGGVARVVSQSALRSIEYR